MTDVAVMLFVHTWTEKAIGFCDVEAESYLEHPLEPLWIPKSVIINFDDLPDFTRDENRKLEIHLPQWKAENLGLDPYCEEIAENE